MLDVPLVPCEQATEEGVGEAVQARVEQACADLRDEHAFPVQLAGLTAGMGTTAPAGMETGMQMATDTGMELGTETGSP